MRKKITILTACLLFTAFLYAQSIKVSGRIIEQGEVPVFGATVMIKDSLRGGTFTDSSGLFSITVPSMGAILSVSSIGYQSIEKIVDSTFVTIVLAKGGANMDEIVVTAFGQKKRRADLVSAVTSVNPSELKIPSSNLTAALQGRVSGIIAFQRNGEPGADNADFFIRGIGSFGASQRPLILIDNIESTSDDLARIPVDDIENFSVLKDASATAMYGSRGANGVILITTKLGRVEAVKVFVRAEQRVSTPTQTLKFADPVTWMRMYNEAVSTRTPLSDDFYTPLQIEKTMEGTDPINYPAVDWLKTLTKNTTTTQNYYASVSGGGEKGTYSVSGNFTNDNGLLRVNSLNDFNNNVKFQVYNLRSNVQLNLTNTTKLIVRTIANIQNYNGPPFSGAEAYNLAIRANPVLFQPVYQAGPTQSYLKHPLFGNYSGAPNGTGTGTGAYLNPYAQIMRGFSERRRSNFQVSTQLDQNQSMITKGLTYSALINIKRDAYFTQYRIYNPFYYQPSGVDEATNSLVYKQLNPNDGTEYLNFVAGDRIQSTSFFLQNTLNYNRLFGKHNINIIGISTLRSELNTPTSFDLINTLPKRNASFSGSVAYGYDSRYNVQLSFGYNGSETFAEDYRFGFFPSLGISWNVSNEKFFENLKSTINNLRLRYTIGKNGVDDILGGNTPRFFYLSNVDLNSADDSYTFGNPYETGTLISGISIDRYSNPNISWEVSTQNNFGVDLELLKGKIVITGDYFRQSRDNIVQTRLLPYSAGFQAPVYATVGKYKSQGFDGELVYNFNINKDLKLQSRNTFTYSTGEYVRFEEPNYPDAYRTRLGTASRQEFGYIAERLFIDDNEVYNSPQQSFGSIVQGGDIKYLDVNRDGVINDNDRMPIGFPTSPEINYGFGLTTSYNTFDFSFFFTGVGRTSLFINPTTQNTQDSKGAAPFGNEFAPSAVLQSWADSYWSESNKNIYADWPRLSVLPQANNIVTSTYWMRDASLLRLKQVEIGYTLNKNFINRFKFKDFRIYANGSNLFRISRFKLWDPEMNGNAFNYPLQRVFNIGITATL